MNASTATATAIAEYTRDFSNREAWREICRTLTRDCGYRIGREMSEFGELVWQGRKRLRRERREAR